MAFSPFHTRPRKRVNDESFSKTFAFARPHYEDARPPFSKTFTLESVFENLDLRFNFSVVHTSVFDRISVDGRRKRIKKTGPKYILYFYVQKTCTFLKTYLRITKFVYFGCNNK